MQTNSWEKNIAKKNQNMMINQGFLCGLRYPMTDLLLGNA
jgi:hypothetical protein